MKTRKGKRKRRPEPHFTASGIISDIVLGMEDGLTVPFAIAAGLSGAHAASHIVIIGTLAEITAGSISMGLGGYLSALNDVQHYEVERRREVKETEEVPDQERQEVHDILLNFGLEEENANTVTEALSQDQDRWVDFMMRFELDLAEESRQDAMKSGIIIGLSYAVAGFIPLSPYFFISNVLTALFISAAVTIGAELIFGFFRGRIMGISGWKSALQMAGTGAIAAGAAYGIARLIRG
jgi:VIT1/CCC1 family predicted Fe2+/Mn2+ transporter